MDSTRLRRSPPLSPSLFALLCACLIVGILLNQLVEAEVVEFVSIKFLDDLAGPYLLLTFCVGVYFLVDRRKHVDLYYGFVGLITTLLGAALAALGWLITQIGA